MLKITDDSLRRFAYVTYVGPDTDLPDIRIIESLDIR